VIGLGTSVQWNFLSGGTTDVFDATGMSLFTSPPTSPVSYYQYTFTAAGVYSVSDGAGHLMTVKVRLTGPATGATGTPFRVRWASLAPAPGFVFDVQVATPGGAFQPWKTGVTSTSALYTPGVAGTYRFRALIRNGSGTATYSPTLTMTVT